MDIRPFVAFGLPMIFGVALALLRFDFFDIVPSWWQMAIVALVAAFATVVVFQSRLQARVSLVTVLFIASALEFTGRGQNFWVDLLLWGAVCGLAGPILATIGDDSVSDTAASVSSNDADRCTSGTGS